MSERNAFGPSLKAERDRRGITLQAIADSTKISISLLAALERNDMSRWPNGIFRRAFVREYVAALGLPPEPVVAERAQECGDHARVTSRRELARAADPLEGERGAREPVQKLLVRAREFHQLQVVVLRIQSHVPGP